MIQFSLFHGTSSHYLKNFEVGKPPSAWEFYEDALSLYRAVWRELQNCEVEPEWHERNIIEQRSGASNWRHGLFYVTPRRERAMSYANHNAANGGELLTSCRKLLERLRKIDSERAYLLEHGVGRLAPLLAGGGRPVLVEISGVNKCDVDPECDDRNALDQIEKYSNSPEIIRRTIGVMMNFSLHSGKGFVSNIEILG